MQLFAAEVHINDFIELRNSTLMSAVTLKFRERASLGVGDVAPDMIFTETIQKLETCIEEGCAIIHY